MELAKAKIEVWAQDEGKLNTELPKSFDVQFNPTQYTREKSVQLAEIGIYGLDSPILQYVRGQNERLTMDLFFDTTEASTTENAKPVTTLTTKFYQLVKLQRGVHAPPRIKFTWSPHLSFSAVVESVRQQFTYFNPAGVPLRAKLSVTFREYLTIEQQLRSPKRESRDHTKRRTVRRGDTLARIAAAEYGDPGMWRPIAEANQLANPRRLAPGMSLIIPSLDASGAPLGDA